MRLPPPGAKMMGPEALHAAMHQMFPPRGTHVGRQTLVSERVAPKWDGSPFPHVVSDGWPNALLFLKLSRLCVSTPPCDVAKQTPLAEEESASSPPTMEEVVAAYLMKNCRFPVECWWISLLLLSRWRELNHTRNSTGGSTRKLAMFPNGLSPAPLVHLMRNISHCNDAWAEVLRLYVEETHCAAASRETHALQAASDMEGGRRPFSRGVLRWMRHTTLTSLLHSGRWIESLHFYRHMLYLRETPSHVCTGHLVQRLGEVGCWTAVSRIFELNLKLRVALHSSDIQPSDEGVGSSSSQHKLQPAAAQRNSNEWGTMFSMALDVVSRVCRQPHVALQMFNEACARNVNGSLFRWDGNFLSAVQALPLERQRLDVLRRAKAASQLDCFKLIRGLVHHRKWLEAIAVFAEGMQTQQLSRREIGRCRLSILHASSSDNAEMVVRRLQSLGGRPEVSLRLNDAEVECVLSKATAAPLLATNVVPVTLPYWWFCMKVLSENYACAPIGGGGRAHAGQGNRRPTTHMLSLLLCNPLPWREALRLLVLSRVLEGSSNVRSSVADSSTSSEALMINHVAEILHAEGHAQWTRDLIAAALRTHAFSPSAGVLEFIPLEFLSPSGDGAAERMPLRVEDKVLYHFVQTTTKWMRALSILRLVECQRAARDADAVGPLRIFPASVHCATLKMIHRCAAATDAWVLSLHYFQHVTSRLHLKHYRPSPALPMRQQDDDEDNEAVNTVVYCVAYELLLNLLAGPMGVSSSLRDNICLHLVEHLVVRCRGRIPTHMLLPNQMDRLLPRFSTTSVGVPNLNGRMRVGLKLARCVVTLASEPVAAGTGTSFSRNPPDVVVLFHELQKLVCRVAEYRCRLQQQEEEDSEKDEFFSDSLAPGETARGQGRPRPWLVDGNVLWQTSLELLERQCHYCGTDAVSPGTLKLVYQTCALSGGRWEAAVCATLHLLNHQKAASKTVRAEHCSLYCSLFGWEKALKLWCRHFPQHVLCEVSHHPKGLHYCMSLIEW